MTKKTTFIEVLHRLDWAAAILSLVAALILTLAGFYKLAVVMAITGALGLFFAWLKPGRLLQRLIERRLFRKRTSS